MKRLEIIGLILVGMMLVLSACGHKGGNNTPNGTSTNNNDSASAVIGTAGGIITTPSGSATLNVPAGALTDDITISVGQTSNSDSLGAILMPYEFGPTGLVFGSPVTVTFSYDPALLAGLDLTQLKVVYDSSGQWVPVDSSVVDTANHTVTGLISHFSDYGLSCYDNALDSPLGEFNGVVAYSNNHCSPTLPTDLYYSPQNNEPKDCHYLIHNGPTNKVFDPLTGTISHATGEEWQCVEYVSRYYWLAYNHNILLPTPNDASAFWENIPDGNLDSRGLVQYSNGGSVAPQVGDIVVFKGNTVAHVAIVREVTGTTIHVIQQNIYLNAFDADAVMAYNPSTNYLSPFFDHLGLKIKGWLRIPLSFNGIGLGIGGKDVLNDSVGIDPMKFSQPGTNLTVTFKKYPDRGEVMDMVGSGQMTGTKFDSKFTTDFMGNPRNFEIKGNALSSNILFGDYWLNSTTPTGKMEFYYSGIAENPALCSGMTSTVAATIAVNYTTNGINYRLVSFSLIQSSDPNILYLYSSDFNLRSGGGWLSGNQILLGFVDTYDAANPKVAILQGTMADDCKSALGTWESHAFGSVVSLATGTWQMTK